MEQPEEYTIPETGGIEEQTEITEEALEEAIGKTLASHYPKVFAAPEQTNFNWGIKEASYLAGFVATINVIGFSEATLASIVLSKMAMEYEKEMLRMKLETDERIASIYSKIPVTLGYSGQGE